MLKKARRKSWDDWVSGKEGDRDTTPRLKRAADMTTESGLEVGDDDEVADERATGCTYLLHYPSGRSRWQRPDSARCKSCHMKPSQASNRPSWGQNGMRTRASDRAKRIRLRRQRRIAAALGHCLTRRWLVSCRLASTLAESGSRLRRVGF